MPRLVVTNREGATSEIEELDVDLAGVTALELTIMPDQRGQAHLHARGGARPDF